MACNWKAKDDVDGHLDPCDTPKEIDEQYDRWDEYYGEPPYTYYVYALLDGRKPGDYIYEPLRFNYEPFYIGYGKGNRMKRSSTLSIQQMDKYNHKVKRMIEIERDGGVIRAVKIAEFFTKEKAQLVEKKFIQLIPRPPLTNGLVSLTEVPIRDEDHSTLSLGPYSTIIT